MKNFFDINSKFLFKEVDNIVNKFQRHHSWQEICIKGDGIMQKTKNRISHLIILVTLLIAQILLLYFAQTNALGSSYIEAPQGLVVTGYYSTASLKWNNVNNPAAAGYAIFRRTSNGLYSSNPIAYATCSYGSNTIEYTDYNLTPGMKYYYKVAAIDSNGKIISNFSHEVSTTLSTTKSNFSTVTNFRLLVPIYSPGIDVQRAINSVYKGVEFFYRNSKGRLNIQPTFFVINSQCPAVSSNTPPDMSVIESDLESRGIQKYQFDLLFLIAKEMDNGGGGWGGPSILGDTHYGLGFYPYNSTMSPYCKDHDNGILYSHIVWLFVHEIGHALEALYKDDGYYMIFNHFPWAYPLKEGYEFIAGEDFDGMAQVLRVFRDFDKRVSMHDGYIEFVDKDKDLMADRDSRLVIDEERFGTSAAAADSDSDGLNDLEEYCAGIYMGSNPLSYDTDRDGIPDGQDPTPFCDFSPAIYKFHTSPEIDGTIDDSWTKLASIPSFQYDDSLEAEFYSGWDDNYLYLGVRSNKMIKVWMSLDGSGHNGSWETDGVFAESGTTDWNSVKQTELAYGDCYQTLRGNKVIYLNPDSPTSKVRLGEYYDIQDSQLAVTGPDEQGYYTMTCKFTKDLGPGVGYSYWNIQASSNIITGIRLNPGRILGMQFTYAPALGSNDYEWNGSWSSLAEVHHYYTTELKIDNNPPTTPSSLTGTVSGTDLTLSWQESYDDSGIECYNIYQIFGDTFELIGTSNSKTYNIRNLVPGATYSFYVRAKDVSGLLSQPSNILVKTIPGNVVKALTYSVKDHAVVLDWISIPSSMDIIGYDILRDGQIIGQTPNLNFTDTSIETGKSYTYIVRAKDAYGLYSDSIELNVATEAKLDLSNTIITGNDGVHYSNLDNAFDDDINTEYVTDGINPAYIQIEFPSDSTVKLSKIKAFLGQDENSDIDINNWWVEAADSIDDLDNASGTYQLIVPERRNIGGTWDEAVFETPVEKKFVRIHVNRINNDDEVHIGEVELWGTIG